MSNRVISWLKLFVIILFIVSVSTGGACSPSAGKPVASNSSSNVTAAQSAATVSNNTTVVQPASAAVAANVIDVVVAGYINHGPLQPTVTAIKDVLSKYSDRVKVTWVDSATQQGQDYFKAHGLTAHMNVIINGTSRYQVNGKTVDFLWFEGQQWNRKDLDTVLSGLVNK
jgi:uncharacterized Zn-binding protein involved in type VI secretion